MAAAPDYRPDIDGLRAVAVLAVILFHVDAALLPGGFAGVDVFFVISGFLITGIVHDGLAAGTFTFGEFYRRRVKRIGPVLAVVILATLCAGVLVLLPEDLLSLAQSAVASMAFVANIYFERAIDTGYFAPSSETIPLLHIWSLGVEEQFYLVWPAVVFLSVRMLSRRQLLLMTLLVAIGSVVLSQHYVGSDPMRGFYRLPSRAFELLAGAAGFIAVAPLAPFLRVRWRREALATAGTAGVIFGLVFITEASGVPGVNALPVTLGTAALLLAGSRGTTVIGAALAMPAMVGIGLISYALYLWHWPVLACLRYLFVDLTPAMSVAAVATTFALAIASYWLVERPARRVAWSFRRVAAAFAVVPFAVVVAAAAWLTLTDGFGPTDPHPFGKRLAELRVQTASTTGFPYSCGGWRTTPEQLADPRCVLGGRTAADRDPKVLLFGDSNAAHYIGVIGSLAQRTGVAFRNVTPHACPPLLALPDGYGYRGHVEDCRASLELIGRELPKYDLVILSGQWSTYVRLDRGFFDKLADTVATLRSRGQRVLLMGQAPLMEGYQPDCLARAIKVPLLDCRTRSATALRGDPSINARLRAFAEATEGVWYLDVTSVLCRGGTCSPYFGDTPLYTNRTHISMIGSWRIGRRLARDPAAVRTFLEAVGRDTD